MSDIGLFKISNDGTEVKELVHSIKWLERELQILIENNMQLFFGVTRTFNEHRTGRQGEAKVGISTMFC